MAEDVAEVEKWGIKALVKKSLLIWYALARMRKPLTLHGPILFILTGLAWKTSKAFINLHHRHLFKVFVLLSLEGHSGGVSHEVLSAFEIFFIIFFSHHKLSLKKAATKENLNYWWIINNWSPRSSPSLSSLSVTYSVVADAFIKWRWTWAASSLCECKYM